MPKPIRVLLADDHPLIREGLRHRLQKASALTLVGEAADGDAVRQLCEKLQPDVLLLDLNMPGPRPMETVTNLRTSCPGTKVVILSAHTDLLPIRTLLDVGVSGYVLKDEAPHVVVEAIQAAADGRTWFSQAIVQQLTQREAVERQSDQFTEHEVQVLHLLAQGWSSERIAEALGISDRAVRHRMESIRGKLNMSTRSEVIAWAIHAGFGHK